MKLKTYLAQTGTSAAEFGRRIGVTNRQTMSRYVAGSRIPKPELMALIFRETGGAVQPNDFFDLEAPE
ncbi:MAG: helix-turn-helix transcriptional regulator [Pseudomonadota bacterium]